MILIIILGLMSRISNEIILLLPDIIYYKVSETGSPAPTSGLGLISKSSVDFLVDFDLSLIKRYKNTVYYMRDTI